MSAVGATPVAVLEPARTVLPLRKAEGLDGGMQFTYRNPERSTDPARLLPGAQTIIAGAYSYLRIPSSSQSSDMEPELNLAGQVARYAQDDYYQNLAEGLEVIAARLQKDGWRTRVVADENGLVDRNAAWLAGLGWYGKNANLLLPGKGSWHVLGAVVTDALIESDQQPLADSCGSCRRCFDGCPTDAIVGPGVIDARRCLAWLVQAPGSIPREFRVVVGDRLYGCDDCQEVCPPNRVQLGTAANVGETSDPGPTVDLVWLLKSNDAEILEVCGRWYIPQRQVDYLRRNALVILGNTASVPDAEVQQILSEYLKHCNPILRAHAIWAARRLELSHLLAELPVDNVAEVESEKHLPVASLRPVEKITQVDS